VLPVFRSFSCAFPIILGKNGPQTGRKCLGYSRTSGESK
jgi:hypothetical protein